MTAGRVGWAVGVLLLGAPASAHELTTTADGTPLTWSSPDVRYDVTADSTPHLAAATRAAFDTWAHAAKGALTPHYLPPRAASGPGDHVSTVSEDSTWDPAFGEPERAVAFAWVQFDPVTGRVREGDVHLNAQTFTFGEAGPGTFDAESVVLHELGHVLGLAHSCGLAGRTYPSCFSVPDDPEGHRAEIVDAVMAPTLAPGTRRRALGVDDRAGLAVHFSGSIEARPRIVGLDRICPSGAWRVSLEAAWSDPLEVRIRQANGVLGRRAVTADGPDLLVEGPEPPPGGFDLVVLDPRTGAYDAWVEVARPPACPIEVPDAGGGGSAPPPEVSEGCNCVVDPPTGSGRGSLALVMLLSSMLALIRRRLLAGLVVAAGLLAAAPASAFECSRTGTTIGPSLIWDAREIPWFAGRGVFGLVGDEAVGREDVLGSYAAWEEPDCSDLFLPFEGEATVEAGFDEDGDNHNVVVAVKQLWPYQAGAIAVTTTAYDTRNGVVVDADIEINATNFRFAHIDESTSCEGSDNLMDLRNTLTHEVGHVVGLEHPPNTARYAESTMFASAPACEIKKRSLAQDDIDGLCFIYPAGADTQQCYPPDGPSFVVVEQDDGFGGCRGVPGETAGLWLLGGLGARLARRRRR